MTRSRPLWPLTPSMRWGLVRSALFVAAFASFVGCAENTEDPDLSRGPLADLSDALVFEGLKNGDVQICLDGTSKPSGVFRVWNKSSVRAKFALDFEGVLVSPSATLLDPREVSIIKVELIDILGGDVSTLFNRRITFVDEKGKRHGSVGIQADVDVRILHIEAQPTFTPFNYPQIVLTNPMPVIANVRFITTGKWESRPSTQPISARRRSEIMLQPATGDSVAPGIAAEVKIDGTRCSKAELPEPPSVIIPERDVVSQQEAPKPPDPTPPKQPTP